MKNLLLISVLTVTSMAFGQLHVSPNGATDSYIYVDDEVIFVEQDVNLVANNPGTTEASIYLRNQAQLIQGSTVASNSGTGTLSVYQDSNADAYDYNFWCSPVSTPSGTGNTWYGVSRLNDIVDITDSNPANTTTGYNGWSSPLTISQRWLHRWGAGAQRWVRVNATDGVPPGFGFIMKGTDVTVHADPYNEPQNQNYDFRGRPNNGDITYPTQFGVPFTDGNVYNFTLAGNPYPSALNLYRVYNDPDNTEIDSFAYWDEDRSINSHNYIDNKGGYGVWVPGTSETDPGTYTVPTFMNYDSAGNPTSSTGVMGIAFERLNAPIGQGFMIVSNAVGSVIIKNSHRIYTREGIANNSQFRGPAGGANANSFSDVSGNNGTNIVDISVGANTGTNTDTGGGTTVINPGDYTDDRTDLQKLRIHTVFNSGTHFRDMVLMFHESATDNYDRGFDAKHPTDGAISDAFFPIEDIAAGDTKKAIIQTVPFEITKEIPLSLKIGVEGKVEIRIAEEINIPGDLRTFILDTSNGSRQEITYGEDAGFMLSPGVYEDRFFIVFRNGRQANEDNQEAVATKEIQQNVDFFQNNTVSQLEVSNPEGYDIKSANLYDMSGKLVYSQYGIGKEKNFNVPTDRLSDGIYLVKLQTVDNIFIDYKMSVYNR
ncbi:T9SS type A sorting domain-containing protein [Altibacter sp. HG106]|uniref:T9SS type A sorting domain-containing protein n=1 Tax=Altibacter sp. HG106 TaxID=3023937 RepID=UPI0023504182|nr:T9SS type A sorting domain-containing protein [Altibacter sp. HG106]MDC7996176.1 T9SS type A sorting domain-containing protein [Altibacter sp. HG106]